MPTIVAGQLIIEPGSRMKFLEKSKEFVALARSHESCLDFSVSPDVLDLNRVNIFEKWTHRAALEAFRDSGPEDDLFSLVESSKVNEYEVDH